MSDDPDSGKLHIDSNWKEEAQREKERFKAEEAKAEAAAAAATATSNPSAAGAADTGFLEIINLLFMEAAAGLGAMATPGGERIPANPGVAKHFIDMLDVLEKKTAGNLADEEKKTLDTVLYDLRMRYVQAFGGSAGAPPKADPPSETA